MLILALLLCLSNLAVIYLCRKQSVTKAELQSLNQRLTNTKQILSKTQGALEEQIEFLSACKDTAHVHSFERIIDIRCNRHGEWFYVILAAHNNSVDIYLANHHYRGLANLPRVLCTLKTDSSGATYIYQEDIFAEEKRVGNGSLLEMILEEYARDNNISYIKGKISDAGNLSVSDLQNFYRHCGFEVNGVEIIKHV